MLDISALLEKMKNSPYEEIDIFAPHTGVVNYANIEEDQNVEGIHGVWKEKKGTKLLTINRERNPKSMYSPQKGEVQAIFKQLEGQFVEAGTLLLTIRHFRTREEVQEIILKHALVPFLAPEGAKYYFTPAIANKIRAMGAKAITVKEGMELFIMSRMKRELPLNYVGPTGVIYAIYFKYNENVEAGQPLIGVCPPDQIDVIANVVMRVQTEWPERD